MAQGPRFHTRPFRRWRRCSGLLCLALFGVLLAAACGPTSPAPPTLDAAGDFAQEVAAELPQQPTYRIGINTEVTGTGAQIGDLSIRAARLAVEQINAAGGVNGMPLELVVRDCRSDVTAAVEQYRKAVAEDGLVALLGPFKSAYAVAVVPEHRGNALPMFIGATNYTLTEMGDQNLYRMRPNDRLTAAAMVVLAVEKLNVKRIGVIHDADAFGSGGAERVAAELAQRGLAPAITVSYRTGTKDFDALVLSLKEAGLDAVLIYGTNPTDVGLLLRAIRYWDLDAALITSPGGATAVAHNVAAEAQDGIYVAVDAFLAAAPEGAAFADAFQQRFGLPPDTYIAWIYDSIYLIADALRKHPAADPAGLNAAIRATAYEGAQGRYQFNAAGEGLRQVSLVRMAQGEASLVGSYSEEGFVAAPSALQREGR